MADSSSNWDNTNDTYHMAELQAHLAHDDSKLAREDDGFVGLDTVKPDAPDDSMHFIHSVPEETYTRPIPGSNRIESVRSYGAPSWSTRTVSLQGNSGTIRLVGKRRGRRQVDIYVPNGSTVIVSSDKEVTQPQPNVVTPNGFTIASTGNQPFVFPTEAEVWACVPIGAAAVAVSVIEYFSE